MMFGEVPKYAVAKVLTYQWTLTIIASIELWTQGTLFNAFQNW